jgi:hypothetical protein
LNAIPDSGVSGRRTGAIGRFSAGAGGASWCDSDSIGFLVYFQATPTLANCCRMNGRLIAISDIHGCHLEFAEVLERLPWRATIGSCCSAISSIADPTAAA